MRYIKSFEWKLDEALQKLITTEKWRRDNGCMEVHRSEIEAELKNNVNLHLL